MPRLFARFAVAVHQRCPSLYNSFSNATHEKAHGIAAGRLAATVAELTGSFRSPEQRHAVRATLAVVRYQCHAFGFRLREEQAVERVTVMKRQ
jgi:hypothetical protein